MSNHPYNNAKPAAHPSNTDGKHTPGTAEEPSKLVLEHAGEMDSAQYDAMLHEALADREQMQQRKKKTARLVTAACFIAVCGSSYAWYASSSENQEMVHTMWSDTIAIGKEAKDSADVGKIMEDYDAAMDKIAVRQDQVLGAAESIGSDMTDDAVSREHLEQDMRKVTGDSKTVAQRDAALQKKFGKFAEEKRRQIESGKAHPVSTEQEGRE